MNFKNRQKQDKVEYNSPRAPKKQGLVYYPYKNHHLKPELNKSLNIKKYGETNPVNRLKDKSDHRLNHRRKTLESSRKISKEIKKLKPVHITDNRIPKFKYVVENGKLVKKKITKDDIKYHTEKLLHKSSSNIIKRPSSITRIKNDHRNRLFSKGKAKRDIRSVSKVINKSQRSKNQTIIKINMKSNLENSNGHDQLNLEEKKYMEKKKKEIRMFSSRDLKSYIVRNKP